MPEDRDGPLYDPGSGATLVPVDHDPYNEPSPPGYFGKIANDLADFWQQPVEHVKAQLSNLGADIGGGFSQMSQGGLQRIHELTSADYSNQPVLGYDTESGQFTGRLPAAASMVTQGLAGPVPGGGAAGVVLGAGPVMRRAAQAAGGAESLDTPIDDTVRAARAPVYTPVDHDPFANAPAARPPAPSFRPPAVPLNAGELALLHAGGA